MFVSLRDNVSILILSAQQDSIDVINIINLSGEINVSVSNKTELLISNIPAYAGGMCISPFPISIK